MFLCLFFGFDKVRDTRFERHSDFALKNHHKNQSHTFQAKNEIWNFKEGLISCRLSTQSYLFLVPEGNVAKVTKVTKHTGTHTHTLTSRIKRESKKWGRRGKRSKRMTNEIRSSGETVTGRRNGLPRNQGEDYTMYSIIYYTKFSVRFRFFSLIG